MALRPSAPAVEGLTAAEAARRLVQHGPNQLADPPRRSALVSLAAQFSDLLVIALLVAAVLAGIVGDLKDSVVIGAVLLLNALLGFVQEHRAEQSLAALRSMLVETATVRRDGRPAEVPGTEVVHGDVVLLAAGDRVPADARILVAHGLEIDESSLTGESTPVEKRAGGPTHGDLGDRSGAVFMNTSVTRGRAEVEVTATGMSTEIGAVAGMLRTSADPRTPLQHQLDALGRRLAGVAGVAVAAFVTLELTRGVPLSETLLNAVALAVAAVPEGLPAVVTVTLAVGTYQMARRGAIVKRLASVETLGATSVICSDKTGTLTLNQMTARVLVVRGTRYDIGGEGYAPVGAIHPPPTSDAIAVALTGVLCNDSTVTGSTVIGDPTEGALITLAAKLGIDVDDERRRRPRVAELPFDSTIKVMATFHRDGEGEGIVAHVKGALDVILARTNLDEERRSAHLRTMEELAGEGLRVLGLARRRIDTGVGKDPGPEALRDLLDDLELVGVVGLVDPPRPEAREAIAVCGRAGIEVKMITGDHAATATAIAAELGLGGEVVTGRDLDAMTDEELAGRIGSIGVVARVAPEHKVRIVHALRDQGHVVAMTGDGVNDAPALKAADIGVAMGITGTEVSKEAAAMVLTDDNFATIVGAVEQGRTIHTNIVTFVRFQLATNIGAILTVLASPLLGLPVPFTAIQLLWVNIIMDGPPAMALGVDPPRPGIMRQGPRARTARILTVRRLSALVWAGAVMATGTLALLAATRHDLGSERALTMAFSTFVLFQAFNAINARTERASVLRRASLTNAKLWAALAAVVALQVAVVHVPVLQRAFDTTALSAAQWATCVAVASSVLWLEEARKALRRAQAGRAAQEG